MACDDPISNVSGGSLGPPSNFREYDIEKLSIYKEIYRRMMINDGIKKEYYNITLKLLVNAYEMSKVRNLLANARYYHDYYNSEIEDNSGKDPSNITSDDSIILSEKRDVVKACILEFKCLRYEGILSGLLKQFEELKNSVRIIEKDPILKNEVKVLFLF